MATTKKRTKKAQVVRYCVKLSKRGKSVFLTLNGGSLFKDAKLALNGAKGAMQRDGYTRAVIHEMVLDETRATPDGLGLDRFWKTVCKTTLRAPKKVPAHV